MGSCLSVSISCDQVVNQISQCLSVNGSYIYNLSENLAALHKEMEVLKAKRDDVQARISREEFTGRRQMLAQVQVWLKNVLDIENQFNDLLRTSTIELQSSQGELDVVTEEVHVTEVEEILIQPTIVGHETLLERVWNRLMDDGFGVLGLYGMGGVGKTTLLARINNKFTKTRGSFKFVLFLDDIWAKVKLLTIGVPYPNIANRCKVAFTTRSRDVCGRMEVDDLIEVSCLSSDKAWELFQKKVGESTLKIHADIPDLARQVSGKCSGLPLALNVIGETMSCKSTVQEWRRAVDGFIDESQSRERAINQELQLLEYLEKLTIEVSSGIVLEQLLSSHTLVKCIQKVGINNLGESTKVLTLPTTCDPRRLNLSGCRMGEIQIERATSSPNNTGLATPCFTNLSRIDISICYLLKDLTWLVFAPNLVDLRVTSSHQLEEIISKEKAASCPMLRKFPLDSNSVVRFDGFSIEYREEEWIKEVEWEDEATQLRFLPFCKLDPGLTVKPNTSNTHTQSINSVEGSNQ
uniref:NB-ARC domain-containing protein n=1 Tax=Brassica campestris TaxID=3711 RepID=A0A3P5YLI9_BRACM|nr:unnamed protein product [Brassica rapa]